ncbi:MAG: hypothetical protein KDA84_12015 [Planctomycetaceae bacterium]|nr:hypothetical protein [Planctomycetaceae bacterium]
MIYVGLDDTDTLDSPGTNQIAKAIVRDLADRFECVLILRHQLLDDPRVPYTSKNGSASVLLKPLTEELRSASDDELCDWVFEEFRTGLKQHFVPGSDPGLCVAVSVPPEVVEYGQQCKRELMSQTDARDFAQQHQIRLEGLGGTQDGVIGALAAIGLAASRNDGRVVKLGTWADDLTGPHPVETVLSRNVLVRNVETKQTIKQGIVDVGKHLRPNYRQGQVVLFAEPAHSDRPHVGGDWKAVRFL